jgi:hypothetical protein
LFYVTILPIAKVLYSTGDTQINDWWNDIDRKKWEDSEKNLPPLPLSPPNIPKCGVLPVKRCFKFMMKLSE